MYSIVALVPMRHNSQRVPGKNYRLLGGKPLYHYILETLLKCPEINQIVVDTDSPDISIGLNETFPGITLIERPSHLLGDNVSMNEILLYDTEQVSADFYLQTHSTNPLLRPDTISEAIQSFLKKFPKHDSLFSVTRLHTRLWNENGQAINHDPKVLIQTQDLPPVYEENSCIYLFTKDVLHLRRNRLGFRPMMFEIPAFEAWDIDEELDFNICDSLIRNTSGD